MRKLGLFFQITRQMCNNAKPLANKANKLKPLETAALPQEYFDKVNKQYGLAPKESSPEERQELIRKAKERDAASQTAKPIRELTQKEREEQAKAIDQALKKHADYRRQGFVY